MNQKILKALRRAARREQPDATRRYERTNVKRHQQNVGSVEIAAGAAAPFIFEWETATCVNAPGTQRAIYREARRLVAKLAPRVRRLLVR